MNKKEDVMVYSSVVGELVKMVNEGVPQVFVKWEDYLALKNEKEEVEFILEGLNK